MNVRIAILSIVASFVRILSNIHSQIGSQVGLAKSESCSIYLRILAENTSNRGMLNTILHFVERDDLYQLKKRVQRGKKKMNNTEAFVMSISRMGGNAW